ncbi:MAG: GNAT family N-acetyltransferase [Saprospiraceae bacterium]
MEKYSIRKARMEDLETLLRFEQGVIEAERPMDETLRPGTIHYYDIRALISEPHIELLVAVLPNGQLIGSGYARIEPSKPYLNHRTHAYLGFMYVEPEYRGRGINQELIEGLKAWCKSQEVFELQLEVYDVNKAAIRSYEKAGFSKNLVNMRLGLDQG